MADRSGERAMSLRSVSPCCVALAIILGGCAGPMGPIRSDPPAPPPTTSFDGSYRTTIGTLPTKATEGTIWCNTSGQEVVAVVNGQFIFAVPHPDVPGNPTPTLPATFAADGTFFGQVTSGMIYGRVQGRHMEGRIDGSACLYTFTGQRI
jgi:hypothetical protein